MKKVALISGISFFAGAVIFALTFGFIQSSEPSSFPNIEPQRVKAESVSTGGWPNFAPLVKKVKPAVVKVVSEAMVESRRSVFGDDFFDRFFNTPRRQEKVSGTGSGFFVSPDGYLVTNYHVIKDALKISILDINDKEYKAKKIGVDPKTDLALLKVKGENFPFIEFGDSNLLEVGEWVLAIGNPLGQDLSVTSGIVSAKGRELSGLEVDYQNFIQTDAAINRGNSGGPLINMAGKAIGINSVILSTTGGSIGIGFAIPANMAEKVINDLKRDGKVTRGYLGISIQDMDAEIAKELDLAQAGPTITHVEEGTPADKAGLKKWDVVATIDGKKIKNINKLKNMIGNLNPGDTVDMGIYRGKRKLNIKVKIGEAPESEKLRGNTEDGSTIDLGMIIRNNNRSLAKKFDLPIHKGVLVLEVERNGVAHQNGLRANDIIVGLNRIEIETVEQFRKVVTQKGPGSRFLLIINRNGSERMIRFEIPD